MSHMVACGQHKHLYLQCSAVFVLPVVVQVCNLYRTAPDMRNEDGGLLGRIGDTFIISGDIYCNAHTDAAARSAAGCAIQVSACRWDMACNARLICFTPVCYCRIGDTR